MRSRFIRRLVRDADIELLHSVPMLRVLPQPTIEQLAAALVHAEVAPGHAVFEQGDHGDHFYVIEAGSADVVHDGRPSRPSHTASPSARSPCCATACGPRASAPPSDAPLRVSVLPRTTFLTAVTGYPASASRRGTGRRRAPRTRGQRGLRHCSVTTPGTSRERLGSREWANEAVRRIEADANRSADTHLHAFPLPAEWGIDLYLKDESVHPTGSLKHRLARSLFLYGLCNGWITERTTIVEASSGSTAVSEAYFARFLGLPFVAVMPASTSPREDRADRGAGRLVPPGRRPEDDRRRGAAAGGRARRALPRPVHLRRARDGLARQQQHRGVDLQPDGAGAAPRSRRGSWWAPEPAGRARRSAATRA